MRDNVRQQFRWAPHTGGVTVLKPKDFEAQGEIQAVHHYEAWTLLRGSEGALQVGDVLESESGELRICKYVGFEEAKWLAVEPRGDAQGTAGAESVAQPAA